jgi:hypothetical protein
VDARIERARRCRAPRRPVSAPTTSAASSTGSNVKSACSASAVETCVPLMSARPSFGRERERRDAGAAQHVGRGAALAVDDELAFADQREREVRERREVARRADRSLRRDERHEAGVVDGDERATTASRTPEWPRARLAALRPRIEPHDRRRQRVADADAVRADQVELQLREVGASMRVPASLPKPVLTP